MTMTWKISFYSGGKINHSETIRLRMQPIFSTSASTTSPGFSHQGVWSGFRPGGDAPRGARGQHIAGVEPHLRPIRDHSADTKDHVTEIGILTHFAVNR